MQVKVWSSLAAVMVALVVVVKVVGLVVVLPSVPAVVDQEPKLEPVVRGDSLSGVSSIGEADTIYARV